MASESQTGITKISGQELKALRESLYLSQQACADLVHVTLNAWQKWESGMRPVNQTALELFRLKTEWKKYSHLSFGDAMEQFRQKTKR